MSEMSKILGRGTMHAFTGLCAQALVAGILFWISKKYPESAATRHVLWASFSGTIIWLHTMFLFMLLKSEATNLKKTGNVETKGDSAGEFRNASKRVLVCHFLYKRMHFIYHRVLTPFMEIGAAGLLLGSAIVWFRAGPSVTTFVEANYLMLIALYSALTLGLVMFSHYLSALMRVKTWHLLRGGRNYTNYICLMMICLLVKACCGHFGVERMGGVIEGGFTALNSLLAAEMLLIMVVRFFTPRRSGVLPRFAFDFYLLEGIANPGRIGRTFSVMLESIFGFDIARTSFGKIAGLLILPAVVISLLTLFGISSVVVVKPGEQGVLLNFGHLSEMPLDAGIHIKLPWPLATVRHYNVNEVRSVHVGSHKPRKPGGNIYQEGVPILWTNMHGISVDELLVCASPRDMVTAVGGNGRGGTSDYKAPSVSLAAADVRVQYVINDVIAYACAAAAPEIFLEKIAESQASRFIYRYDIDDLFCEGRLSLVDEIMRAVQEDCDRHAMGVDIVHVAITAVHPPVDVASAFEETVVAMQERETRIQHAEQAAIRSQVESTGSSEAFAMLASLVDSMDSFQEDGSKEMDMLLRQCGGEISRILAEAEAYRFSRENVEQGKTERFEEQLGAYDASARNYRYDRYFFVLESGLAEARKVVLPKDNDSIALRMGLQPDTDMWPEYE